MNSAARGASVHVIAGHFHDGTADLYSVPVSGGRYGIVVPIECRRRSAHRAGILVDRAQVPGRDDVVRDLTLGGMAKIWLEAALPMRSIGAAYNEAAPKAYVSRIHPLR